MPELEEKKLPTGVFSMSAEILELRISTLPNSMLPVVQDSLKKLSKLIGSSLIMVDPEETKDAAQEQPIAGARQDMWESRQA